jgi:formate hydrogenlyase subunit 4
MLLAEGNRVPVDDPNTHLELTMIHEVMVLDYSGPDLAFMVYAAGMKMMLIAVLIANLCIPPFLPSMAALFLFIGILFFIYIAVGAVESFIARSRMSHVPQFIFLMTALSLTAFAVVAFFLRGGIS